MNKLLIFTILLGIFCLSSNTDFCSGWNDGYSAGYCYEEDFCIPPILPICPVPFVGKDTYEDGFERGFTEGLNGIYIQSGTIIRYKNLLFI